MFTRFGERNSDAFASGSSDTTDSMDVGLRGGGHVVIDDMGEMVDVEATSGDVSGDEEVSVATPNPSHNPVASFLVHASVECFSAVAASVEGFCELINFVTSSAEHDRCGGGLDVKNAAECGGLMGAGHDKCELTYQRSIALCDNRRFDANCRGVS